MAVKPQKTKVETMESLLQGFLEDGASIAADENFGESEFVDTGSHALNLVVSGSIFGGILVGAVSGIAGEEATGKTFFTLGIVKNFLDADQKAIAIIFDTEGAIRKDFLTARGIDAKRVLIERPATIEEFRTKALKFASNYEKVPLDKRNKIIIVLDSLGNISTLKEMADVESGAESRDMTRAQLVKGAFRVLTSKLATVKIPLLVTNHVYAVIGSYFPTKEQAGGSGLKYAASSIVFLSKSKDKDASTKEVMGNFIRVIAKKSRFSKENSEVTVKLSYEKGLDRYYGLLGLAKDAGLVAYASGGGRYTFPDGNIGTEKEIYKTPEKFFTEEFLTLFEDKVSPNFRYGLLTDESSNDED